MPLTHDLLGRKLPQLNDTHLQMASRLRECIVKNTGKTVGYNRKLWSQEFAKLETRHSRQVIEAVIQWYSHNMTNKYVPVCHSAKSFRTKFDRLLQAKDRILDKKELPLSAETMKILSKVLTHKWPDNAKSQLPTIIEQSVRNYKPWREFILDMHTNTKYESTRFVSALKSVFGPTIDYLIRWFTSEYQSLTNSSRKVKWDGVFKPNHIFSMDHPAVVSIGQSVSMSFSQNCKHWNDFYSLYMKRKT